MIMKLLNTVFALSLVFTFSAFSGESCSFANENVEIESGIIQVLKGGKSFDEIIVIEKGSRSDPSTYLNQDYINNHLSLFDDGATRIQWKAPDRPVGPPGGTFAMPKSTADEIIKKANGDVSKLEDLLGLDRGYLGKAPVRVDIPKPKGVRIPSGNELGANDFWKPGGYASAVTA